MPRTAGPRPSPWIITFALCAATATAAPIGIDHKGVGCVVAERYPRLVSCFSPASALARARIYFRAQGSLPWYYVEMRSEAPCFVGVLPKPRSTTPRIEYYLEATDKAFDASRTADFTAQVVPDAGSCRKDMMVAMALPKASVLVSAPPGAPALPQGFAGGAAASGAPAQASTAASSTPPATAPPAPAPAPAPGPAVAAVGGGLSTTALIVIGGAVVAGGGIAYAATRGGGNGGSNATTTSPSAPAALPTASASVGPAGTALAGATLLAFTASGSGSGVSYSWDFGDGAAGSGASATHTYAAAGSFSAKLTATNSAGSASASVAVVVASLSGSWDYLLSNGFRSGLSVSQSGAGFNGSGNGFTISGTVADPRRVTFGVQSPGCNESFDGSADTAVNTVQGTVVSCNGQSFTLTLQRR